MLKELNTRKLEEVFMKYYKEFIEVVTLNNFHDHEYFYKNYELQNQKEIFMDWSKNFKLSQILHHVVENILTREKKNI